MGRWDACVGSGHMCVDMHVWGRCVYVCVGKWSCICGEMGCMCGKVKMFV